MVADIAILGAGPSGLTLARLLEINNVDYIVFERDSSPSEVGQGGSLDIHRDSGQVALEEAGLLKEFNTFARFDGQSTVAVDQHGELIMKRVYEGQNDKPEIDRKDLREILLKSVPQGKIRWGCRVQTVGGATDNTMSVSFDNGNVERGFKLVVGADGAWSKVRHFVTSATPQYSGIHYLQTSISPSNPFYKEMSSKAGKGTFFAMGSGKQIAAQYTGDGSYNIYVGLPLPEHWERLDDAILQKNLLQNEFDGWNTNITDILAYSGGSFHAWPLYAMPVPSLSWQSVPGLTLVGDAAHVSTPFVGEGVNTALFDGLQLAQEIVKHGRDHLNEAVVAYERKMLPRAIDLITRSKASGELLFAEDSPKGFREMLAMMSAES